MSRKKKYTIWIIILLVVAGIIFYFVQSGKPKITYTTESAAHGDLAQTVSVTGEITADNKADLSFKTSGKIISMLVAVGDKVAKGQALAEIDRGTLSSQLAQADTEIKYQQEILDNMVKNHGSSTGDQRDAQRARLRGAKAAKDGILKQISETKMFSPMEGIVIRKNANQGEMAVASSTILTIAKENDLIAELNVPESDIIKVQLGQKASLSLDAYPSDVKFESEVSEIEPASTVIQDVVYYKVKLKLENVDPQFKVGMSADADIRTAEKKDVVMIPLRAVKTEGDKEYVEILKVQDGKEVTEKTYVTTGLHGDDGMVEVVSGLSGGEKVITLTKTQ